MMTVHDDGEGEVWKYAAAAVRAIPDDRVVCVRVCVCVEVGCDEGDIR